MLRRRSGHRSRFLGEIPQYLEVRSLPADQDDGDHQPHPFVGTILAMQGPPALHGIVPERCTKAMTPPLKGTRMDALYDLPLRGGRQLLPLTALFVMTHALLGISSCDSSSPDADGDGWTVDDGDCDDTNAGVNPAATESCNSMDDDCDGAVDEGCTAAASIQSIEATLGAAFAVDSSGRVWASGCNGAGLLGDGTVTARATPGQVPGLGGITEVSAAYHAMALNDQGKVWVWGENGDGQLGNGTYTDSLSPIPVSTLSGIVSVGAGGTFSLALDSTGTAWSWGDNSSGQLGDGSFVDHISPAKVPTLTGAVAVAAGLLHGLALDRTGAVWAWGDNFNGQLGDGTLIDSPTPKKVQGLSGIVAIKAGTGSSFALDSQGRLWAWGANEKGQLGDGTTVNRAVPVQVAGLQGISGFAVGSYHVLATDPQGTVWGWGDNANNQLGDVRSYFVSSPTVVPELQGSTFGVLAAGAMTSFAMMLDGEVWAAGSNSCGDFGDGTYSKTQSTTPVQPAGLTSIAALAQGKEHSIAATTQGTVWTWGGNSYGQLGDGGRFYRDTPTQVQGLSGVVSVAAGVMHSLAVTSQGTLWTWGQNVAGQLGDGTTQNRSTPVTVAGVSGVSAAAAGRAHSLVVDGAGFVWAWGDNAYGQLGDGTTAARLSPVKVPGLSGMVAVAAGDDCSLALDSQGRVWTWGDNSSGQLGDGTQKSRSTAAQVSSLSGIAAISASAHQAVAVTSAGTVWFWGHQKASTTLGLADAWGSNSPVAVSGLQGIVAAAAMTTSTLVMDNKGVVWGWGYNVYNELGAGGAQELPADQVPGLLGVSGLTPAQARGALAGGVYTSLVVGADRKGQGLGYQPTGQLGNDAFRFYHSLYGS